MGKYKTPIWIKLLLSKRTFRILWKWQRMVSLAILCVFSFNIGSPTALAMFQIQSAQAQGFGGALSSTISTIFGQSGELLEKFSTKPAADNYEANAQNKTQFDLVAILVDEDLANNSTQYDGLISTHNPTVPNTADQAYRKLTDQTLIGRVERYAKDIQGINKVKDPQPFQKTAIIKVKNGQPTDEIAAALEKLYREGDGTLLETNRLKGLVIVGDVQLPVVNKNGNRFVSLFPYTDFDDPYYIFDDNSKDFIVNSANQKPGAEVWHGVIKPPAEGEEGNKLLAEYFDKNHLFKVGEPAYRDFAKKIFYSDLNKEFNLIGVEGIPSYLSYLKYWEDISYFRFNKNWAKNLFAGSSFGKPAGDGFDNDGDGKIDEDPFNGYDDDGDAEKGSPLFGLINRVDDDGDGEIDNDEEGVWGYCSTIPATGKKPLENCQNGSEYKTGNFYNVKPGSFYFVGDDVNNNDTEDQLIDEGIDEDEGDALINIDNDRDGRVDEDTSADNDKDGDDKTDEDAPGDMNGDGCPGECDVDEDSDSIDGDTDIFPTGYEKEYGSLDLSIAQLGDLIDAAASGNAKEAFATLQVPTDPESTFDFPRIQLFVPPFPPIFFPRFMPFPDGDEWIDEGSNSDDDEDGVVDEDGTDDNDNDKDGTMDEDPGDALGNGDKGDGGNIFENLPDIRSKDIIMNFFKKYNELFDKFYADINSWTNATGRYDSSYKSPSGKVVSDLTTFPFLIAAKDEFTRIYLKAVNDAVERRVDNYVQKLPYDIQLAKGASLSGYVVLPDANGVFPPNQKIRFHDVNFINFGYKNDAFFSGIEPLLDLLKTLAPAAIEPAKESFLESVKGPVTALTPIYINGKPIDTITNIVQCSLYRGSEGDENSQMVIANTVYDPTSQLNTTPPPQMPKEWSAMPKEIQIGTDSNDYHGLYWWWNNDPASPMVQWLAQQRLLNKSFAGCFAENANTPDRCFPSLASRYIFSLGGGKQVTGISNNAVSHQACFDLKEKDGYDAFALAANIYLKSISEKVSPEEKGDLDSTKPPASAAYRTPQDTILLNFSTKLPVEYEVSPGSYLPIPPALLVSAVADPTLSTLEVNFEQILKKYLGGDRVDNNSNGTTDETAEANTEFFAINPSDNQPNWYQVGEQLLQDNRTNEAAADPEDKPLKFASEVIPGTKEVYVRITPIPGKSISSLVFHKEPTIDTIQSQTYELARDANGDFIEDSTLTEQQKRQQGRYKTVTKTLPDPNDSSKTITVSKETRTAISIPIDSPRHITFRDSEGNYKKIIYPNAFRAKDLAEFKQQLINLENELKAITVNPAYASLGPATIEGYLTGVIEPSLENDVINTSFDEISIVAEKKLVDALNWKSLDIDQKHDYALRYYWGSGFKPYTPLSESPKGYEVLYLNSNGASDALSMKFNKDIPEPKAEPKVEKVDCKKPENSNKAACKEEGEAAAPATTSESPTEEEADMEAVWVWEWIPRVIEWAEETEAILNGEGAVTSCPAGGYTDLPGDEGVDTTPFQPKVVFGIPVDLDGNGISDQADNTVKLRISLGENSKNVLRAGMGDQVDVIVEALDKDDQVNFGDNYNSVQLNITNTSGEGVIAETLGSNVTGFAMGKATFRVAAGDNAGTVALQGQLVARPEVKSAAIPLVVSKEFIKLISYRRFNSYQFAEGPAAGYSIFDGEGNLIAEVDPKTGYINILADGYELRVLTATGVKPLRQAVVRQEDNKVMAILYFVVVGNKAVNIDAPSTDYAKEYLNLSGVHIKDLSANDSTSLQTATNEEALKGAILMVDSKVTANKGRVGVIDTRGNVFTGLKMRVKTGPANGPVVFVVEDANGNPSFELFVGAKFELITELPYEDLQDFFAKLPGVMLASRKFNWLFQSAHAQSDAAADLATALVDENATAGDKDASTKMTIPDTDKDGLNDLEEVIIGTKIDKKDSNEDGKTDLENLNSGLDPRIKGQNLFTDIKPGDEGFIEVVKLFRRGLFVADQGGQVRPTDNITREEFIKLDLGGICVICDRFGEKVKKSIWTLYSTNPFPDLDIDEQYKYCVAEGKNRGIISGYKAFENVGYYVPKANMTRAEATKVILETARQQVESFPDFVVNENLAGKPWYYNYVLTAQKESIYPKGKFPALDKLTPEQFQGWFDSEIIKASSGLPGGSANSQFVVWMSQPISRVEFAIMVSRFTDKYNCITFDADGDGLPDNFERYIYSTSPTDPDTDNGGVKDGAEVLRGSNPLDASDDFPLPVEDPNADPDADGLTTARERADAGATVNHPGAIENGSIGTGTDPFDPDTDDGGVTDGMEVLLGTDPLNAADDKTYGQGSGLEATDKDGAYLSGLEIKPKTVYTLPEDDAANQSQINTEETDRVPADGESKLYVRASLYDADGNLKTSDNSSIVKFGFKNLDDGKNASISPLNVKVSGGQAETLLTAKTKTGLPIVIASVEGQQIPTDERLIEVYALEPATAELKAASPIIPSGGKTATAIEVLIKDKNGNLANSGNYTSTFSVETSSDPSVSGQLDSKQDEDKTAEGVQMSSVTGEYNLLLKSGLNPENLTVKLSYQDEIQLAEENANNVTADLLNLGAQVFKPATVTGETQVETRNDLQIVFQPNKTELKSDGKEEVEVNVRVEDSLGNVLTGFLGNISVKMLNDKMGVLIDADNNAAPTLNLPVTGGLTAFKIRSSLKAGDLTVLGNIEGLPMATLKLESYAFKPTKVILESTEDEVNADPTQTYTATAKLYDNAGNFVTRDNSTEITFSIDPESAGFATINSATKVKVSAGEAIVTFKTGTLTGPVRLRAKANKMIDGYLEVYAVKHFEGKDFRQIKPKFLYADLLGSSYGELTKTDYFGGWFVFSGRVQSAASLITDPVPKMRLVEVLTTGKAQLTGAGDLEINVVPTGADNAPVKQIVSDAGVEKDVLEVSVVPKPQSQIKLMTTLDEVDRLKETVNVINLLPESEQYTFENDTDTVSILRDEQLVASIGRDAKIRLLSPLFDISADEEDTDREISWTLTDRGNELAKVIISVGDLGDVKLLEEKTVVPVTPGIYARKISSLPARGFVESFSGNSSANNRGYYYIDESQELDKSQAPGMAYLSLESASKEDGIGLRGDNKNVLLFAGGSTVGEANLAYASDGGVILGDPTVRIDNRVEPGTLEKLYSATGFTKDLGKMIFAGNKPIKEVSSIDYDNDSDKDILANYENGEVRLIENLNAGKGFVDKGMFLNFPTGILSQAVLDINDDGWEDLVVATADSCKTDEVCVDAYLNNQGNFVRKNLHLEGYSAKNKVYMLRAADMNQDAYLDLVVSDDTGSIKIFYVHQGVINRAGDLIGNLGVKINQTDNLKNEVFAYYTGMTGNQAGLQDEKDFEKVTLQGDNANEDKTYELKSIGSDVILGVSSTKNAKDITEPFNVLAEGDMLEYKVKLVNPSSATLNNFLVGDIVPENVSLDIASIKCLDCKGEIALVETGQSLRPYLITGIDMPAGATRTFTYQVTVGSLPKVKIAVGQNLSSKYPVKDGYPDIAATPEKNPTGRIVYYYSISKNNSNGKITYGEYVTPDPKAAVTDEYKPVTDPVTGETIGLDLKLFEAKGPDGLPIAVKHFMDYGTFPGLNLGGAGGGVDTDETTTAEGDTISQLPGIGPAYAGLEQGLEDAAGALEEGIAALTCSGGCIPMPINFAFLVPGPINVMGIPSGFDPGLPVFAWGVPSIIPIWPPSPYQGSMGGRLYLSPTLTGKIAMSTCLGPYLIGFGPVPGNCWTFVLPIDPLAGICEAIAGAIEGALAGANEMISDGSGTIGSSSDGSVGDTPTADGKNYTGGFEAADSMGNYGYKVNAKTNMRIPGFPSVLTDWMDNQQAEIINKLTDMPDIYILLPDILSAFKPNATGQSDASSGAKTVTDGKQNVKNEPVSPKGLRGVLNEINKIPIIQIVPQEVIIKIPTITPGEIDRFINDAKQWVEDEKYEIERVMAIWKCGPFKETVTDDSGNTVPGYIDQNGQKVYGSRPYMSICDIFTVDMTKLIQSVEKNIEILESYKQFPRQVLAWRNMLTKYVAQIICYIDAILQFFVGNIAKWMTQANAWVDAIANLIETIATWKLMIDLVIDYQASCDKCTSARFSLLELILKLFAFIPSPPVIPFPKLPDIYLDFSQIQMGIKIVWPDIKFRPEKIVLPRLPRIILPELPTFKIELPEIPLLPELPALPELPDLPPLTLPALPNLPPPPKVPALPGAIKAVISILKVIFKILCLIKKGFIPTAEATLKSEVEHMTERGLDPLLPFDLGLVLQIPPISYEYVERVVLTVKINLNNALDFTMLYDLVQLVADNLNAVSTNFAAAANSLSKAIESAAASAADNINEGLDAGMPDGNNEDAPLLNYLREIDEEAANDIAGVLQSNPQLAKEFSLFSPQLSAAVIALGQASKELEKEAAYFKDMAASPEFQDIKLVAGTMTIGPEEALGNRNINDLDNFDLNSTLMALGDEFDETKKLAGLRENLLAFAQDNQEIDQAALYTNDLSKFATMMAAAPSVSDVLVKSGYSSTGTMMAAEKKLYAAVPSLNDIVKNSGLPPEMQNQPVAKGMFIYNESLKQNEKIISYEEELSAPTTMNFIDTDKDTDKDLVYSFGPNIYLKENYNKTGSIGKFYGGMPKYHDLEEYIPAARSVSGFASGFSGNKTLDLKWNKASESDLTGYEVIVGPKLGGPSYLGVINDLKAAGLSKYVYLNSVESAGALLTNSLLQPETNTYNFPASQLYELVATEVSGEVQFSGPEQKVLAAGGDKVPLGAGQQIFAAQESMLKVWDNGTEKGKKSMSARELISMPSSFGGKLEIQVESGSIMIIDPNNIVDNQKLLPGAKIEMATKYQSIGQGSALIKLPQDAYTRVDAGQSMQIEVLENPDEPATTLTLENGFYYSVIRSFDQTGFRSLRSESTLLWPNICSDRQDPFPVAGPSEKTVAIFKTLQIDTSKSFDVFGKVVSYYLDTDLETDSNGDGDLTNDKNLGKDINPEVDSDGNGVAFDDLDDPVFFVGPYKDLNDRLVMLNVVDETGNIGQQEITIKIYVPSIFLDESSANLEIIETGEGTTVSGYLEPAESEMPISIMRDRDGVKEIIKTKAANSFGKYYTDSEGKFAITDLNLKDTVIIKNAAGEIIAEIDPKTGRIILKDPTYSIEALPAEEPLLPTRVVVKEPSGKIIATLFVVSDANTDVVIDGPEVPYTTASVLLFKGVHIKNLLSGQTAADFEMKSIPADAEKFAGGIEIVEKASLKRVAVLDSGGNFYIYDPRLKLQLKSAADLKEPMIFEVVLQKSDGSKEIIAQFHVSFSSKKPITILDPNEFKLFVGNPDLKGPKFDTDKDGIPDLWEQQYGLNIDNPSDAEEDPDADGLTNLEEYLAGTNPLMADSDGDGYPDGEEKIFGKDPTSKATSPFIDVDENNPFYQSILNLFQRGILAGIPAGNRLRFGFEEAINRAEYAKVMLDTFCIVPRPEAYTAPGVFTDIPFTEGRNPWYFAATKEAYFQGFITGYRGQIDVRTGRTPFAPEATITKAEGVKIILEALEREGLISLAKIPLTEPYYLPYMQAAQNLDPYMVEGVTLKNNFILTAAEAQDPEKDLIRGEFIALADRVLAAYDCTLIDTDGDGIPDYWEKQKGLNYLDPSDADDDPDKDRLINLQEYKYGTEPFIADTDNGGVGDGEEVLDRQTNPLDPSDDWLDSDGDGLSDKDEVNKYGTKANDPDTDKGGVKDGDEVLKNGTNPLNPLDDKDTDGDGLGDKEEQDIYKTDYLNPDTDEGGVKDGAEVYRGTDPLDPADDLIDPRKDLGEGVYVIPEPCSSCPCPSAIDHTADLIPGDKIIGIISNNPNTEIFSESNLVEIAEIKEPEES